MSEAIRKPYELSVWTETLETSSSDTSQTYYKEKKIAVIGSDKMTSPNRAFNLVLLEKVNGEKNLTFNLRQKYYDPVFNREVENPFTKLLVNEGKIKLYFNDTWYDFIIKESEETSEEYVFSYTAEDLFALELGKVGYNITFNKELNNNQGTITELAEKTLEYTDWTVDKNDSDLLKQKIKEPLYECVVTQVAANLRILNVDTNEELEAGDLEVGETIYIFYSYINGKRNKFIQFIREKDSDKFEYDSEKIITATNYRIISDVTFEEVEEEPVKIKLGNIEIISIGEIYSKNQAYRLVYDQLTTLDPVMQKTVKVYRIDYDDGISQDIYSYTDYQYITSNVVTSFITMGTDFSILDNGDIQGWSAAVPSSKKQDSKSVLSPLSIATYPKIQDLTDLSRISNFATIKSYLEIKFAATYNRTNRTDAYFNSGIMDNASILNHIAAGERFVLRLKYGYADSQHGTIKAYTATAAKKGLRALVAKYNQKEITFINSDGDAETLYGYEIVSGSAILDFTSTFSKLNSYVEGGTFNSDKTTYTIDNIVQTPSTKYCYKQEGDNTEYIWSVESNKYVEKTSSFLDYYVTTAVAKTSFSSDMLSDPNTNIGLFLYTEDSALVNKYIYVEDIQLTRYYIDNNEQIVTIGNIPESKSIETQYYYLKPDTELKSESINVYSDLNYLASEVGIDSKKIYPVYNKNCEKILSIEEAQSNCFNILQSLCETFECWLKFNVARNEDGSLKLDYHGKPIKKVSFKEYVGKDNFAGFKYGINLNSIKRTIDSNEFVTKLIVENVTNDNIDEGYLSIQDAVSNYSKEAYILNFSHYLNTKLIPDEKTCNEDLQKFYDEVRKLNIKIFEAQKKKVKLDEALIENRSNITTLESLVEEAKSTYTEALTTFKKSTGMSYKTYVDKSKTDPSSVTDLLEIDSVVDIIADIYTASVTIDNYSGIVSNLKKEYKNLQLQGYGAKEYGITITTMPDPTNNNAYTTQLTIDDYIDGLDFTLYNNATPVYKEDFISTLNERVFTATVDSRNPFVRCVLNRLPSGYELEYYDNGISHKINSTRYIDLKIYDPSKAGSAIKKYKLVPSSSIVKKYPNLDKIIEDSTQAKKDLEKTFYQKYSRFIQEGTWTSNDHIDSNLYYLDALQVSRTSAQPKVTYDIEVSEISELKDYGNYYFNIGDHTYIEDINFFGYETTTEGDGKTYTTPIQEEVVISEISWHLDEPDKNTVTVQNYKTQFEDLFQRISATVQTVQYNEKTYPKTSAILERNGLINQDLLLQSWNNTDRDGYQLTNNGAVKTDSTGILIQDLTKASNLVKINSRGIDISSDGGNEWANVLNGKGVNADTLSTGTINTQNIWLMDGKNPSFRWDKSGISAYGFNENQEEELYDFGTYVRLDKYGLYGVKDGENYTATSLDDIKNKADFGLTWDGFFIKNSYTNGYVSISSMDDFQIVTSDMTQDLPMAIEIVEFDSGPYIEDPEDTSPIRISLPREDAKVVRVLNEDGSQLENYSVENGIISSEYFEYDNVYTVQYFLPLNFIDLSNYDGIIGVNDVLVNGIKYTNYSFNKKSNLLTFDEELSSGDIVTINYEVERIKIGATEFTSGIPSKYGIEIRNALGETVFESNDEGNLTITGTINATDGVFNGTVYAQDGEFTGHIQATSGDFPGRVTVGGENNNYITINGEEETPFIASRDYIENEQQGWIINGDGDAIFNNVGVRGAIKTSVFEKGEIQTVGGAFLFRPSDTIEKAELRENGSETDLVLTMKQGGQFNKGDLCKLGEAENLEGGLQAIYEISEVFDEGKIIVLKGAGEIFKSGS